MPGNVSCDGVHRGDEVRVRALLPDRGGTPDRAQRDRVQRPVIARREPDQVVDHRARVGPEAQRPAGHHAALGVADDVDPPAVGGVHRADRVDDVLAGGLDVGHPVAGQIDRAVRVAELPQRGLPAVTEVGGRVQRGPGNQQHRRMLGSGQRSVALQRRRQLRRGHRQRRARSVHRRIPGQRRTPEAPGSTSAAATICRQPPATGQSLPPLHTADITTAYRSNANPVSRR